MHVKTVLAKKGYETYSVLPEDSILTTLRLFQERRIGFAVVIDKNDKVLGGISERDICRSMSSADSAGRETLVGDVMNTGIKSCSPKDNLVKVMATMTQARNRHMLVYDDKDLSGVISIGDVVKHRLDEVINEEKELLRYIEGIGYSY